jgi:hypothetical protein
MVDNRVIELPALPIPHLLRPTPLRKRLWQGGVALFVFIATVTVSNAFSHSDKAVTGNMLGHDFLAFYTAGTFVREGRYQELYNLESVKDFQHELAKKNGLELGDSFGPFWNPPFYAWVFSPLSALPYHTALLIWTTFNCLALACAIVLLCRMLPQHLGGDFATWGLVPLLIVTSMPFVQALSHGQNTFSSLLLLSLVVIAWRSKRAILAGMACGLLFYKPQLAAIVAVVLTINLGARVLLGFGSVLSIMCLLTNWTMPGVFMNYLEQLPANVHFMQVEHMYLWERHVTFKGFFRLLLQGRDAGEALLSTQILTLFTCACFGLALLIAALRVRKQVDCPWSGETRAGSRDRLIAATIATMPLLMPFYFDYDLLLLAVPATLFAAEMVRRNPEVSASRGQHWIVRVWAMLFVWLMFNPGLARWIHVNGTVILVTTVSAMLIARAARVQTINDRETEEANEPGIDTMLRQAA